MSKVAVHKAPTAKDRKLPIFQEFEELADQIRVRAYNLFSGRGFSGGGDLDDWLTAERELCWPAAQLTEEDAGFEIKIELAGFEPTDISVTVTPGELMVKANRKAERSGSKKADERNIRWSEFRGNEVYRRIELPVEVDVRKVTAELKNGILTIEAPKAIARQAGPTKVKVTQAKAKRKAKPKKAAPKTAAAKKAKSKATRSAKS